jgi:hypothetical protein
MPTNTNPSKNTPNNEEPVTRSADRSQQLANRILAGITSKRSDEEWEHYVERTIELFRQKSFSKTNPQIPQKQQLTRKTAIWLFTMRTDAIDQKNHRTTSILNLSLSQRNKTNQILIYE